MYIADDAVDTVVEDNAVIIDMNRHEGADEWPKLTNW